MSHAGTNLEFMLWNDLTSVSHKKIERGKYNCRRNLRKKVGDTIYCPYCRKKFKKAYDEQITCGKDKCSEKIQIYVNEIKNKQF